MTYLIDNIIKKKSHFQGKFFEINFITVIKLQLNGMYILTN